MYCKSGSGVGEGGLSKSFVSDQSFVCLSRLEMDRRETGEGVERGRMGLLSVVERQREAVNLTSSVGARSRSHQCFVLCLNML